MTRWVSAHARTGVRLRPNGPRAFGRLWGTLRRSASRACVASGTVDSVPMIDAAPTSSPPRWNLSAPGS